MTEGRRRPWLLLAALAPLALLGCATGPSKHTVSPTEVIYADQALPEETLLDVGVHIFETAELSAEAAAEQGTHAEIREAEARYIPFHLKQTLQQTGQWGAVRVYPARAEEVDVSVSGKLLQSNGETLTVEVKVVDATGRSWFHKEYAAQATEESYRAIVNGTDRDPFQDFYNQVANDMLAYRRQLSGKERVAVRQVAKLKFARSIAPDAFGGYLAQDDGVIKVSRLPADGDPMAERVDRIHAREYMFIDTVNIYYGNLYDDMREPYRQWRRSYLLELNQKRELERKMWERRALGLLALVGAVVVSSNNGSSSGAGVARDLLLIGGFEAFRSSGQFADDAKVHAEALKELGVSFKSDVAPVVDEVDGRALKLSGSVEAQYAEWRRTLSEMYAAETGLEPVAATPPDASPAPESAQ